jgi:uncharacterized OB-fold protein
VTGGVLMSKCHECSWQGLPRRSWCPRCGSSKVGHVRVTSGVLAETTVVSRSPSGRTVTEPGDEVRLGIVHAHGGGTLVVRVSRRAVESEVVALSDEGGVTRASDESEVGT